MFGVVPKSIWQKSNPSDENNLCNWAMRCLLIEEGKQLILIDNGMGNKQDAKFFNYYCLNGDDSLDKSLLHAGFHENDITDMFLTHLHFDHCGGGLKWEAGKVELTFKNAQYWSNPDHWKRLRNPTSGRRRVSSKTIFFPCRRATIFILSISTSHLHFHSLRFFMLRVTRIK